MYTTQIDIDVSSNYSRTSTPIPGEPKPIDLSYYKPDKRYVKFTENLSLPPSKLRVRGVVDPPAGVISGHLFPEPTNDKDEPKKILQSPDECILSDVDNLEDDFTRLVSLFNISRGLIKKVAYVFRKKENNKRYSKYKLRRYELRETIMLEG